MCRLSSRRRVLVALLGLECVCGSASAPSACEPLPPHAVYVFIAIFIFVASAYVVLVALAKFTGGSLNGGIARMATLGIWSLTTAQVRDDFFMCPLASATESPHDMPQVVSQAASVRSPSTPAAMRMLYRALAGLQLQGILLPPSCTGA